MPLSPTQRTLKRCRENGWLAKVVEKWNPHSKTRLDLFGVIDIVALDMVNRRILGIQATSGSGASARMRKCEDEERLVHWLACGGGFEVWAWRKTKVKRGGKAVRWNVRRVSASFSGTSEALSWAELE